MKRNFLYLGIILLLLIVIGLSYLTIYKNTRPDLWFNAFTNKHSIQVYEKSASGIDLSPPSAPKDISIDTSRLNDQLGVNTQKSSDGYIYYNGIYLGFQKKNLDTGGGNGYLIALKFADDNGRVQWFLGGGRIGDQDLYIEYYNPVTNPDKTEFYTDLSQKLELNSIYQLEVQTLKYFIDAEKPELGIPGAEQIYYTLMKNEVTDPQVREKRTLIYLTNYFLLQEDKLGLNNMLTPDNLSIIKEIIPIVRVFDNQFGQ